MASDGNWYPPTQHPSPSPDVGYVPRTPMTTGIGPEGRFAINGREVSNPWKRLGAYCLDLLLAMVTCGIGWAIWALIVAAEGYTPARKLLRMRTVRTSDGKVAGYTELLLVRGLALGAMGLVVNVLVVAVAAAIPPLAIFGLISPLWIASWILVWQGPKTETLADRISGCVVVDE